MRISLFQLPLSSVGGRHFESIALQATNYFTLEEVELQQSYPIGRNLVWLIKSYLEIVVQTTL